MATNYPTGDTDQAIVVWGGDGVKAVDVPVGVTGTGVMAAATPSEAQVAIGLGLVHVVSADTILSSEHNGGTLIMSGNHALIIDDGLPVGFGCAIKGDFTYDGTADVTDVRDAAALYPWCAIVQTGTNTYDLVGNKT